MPAEFLSWLGGHMTAIFRVTIFLAVLGLAGCAAKPQDIVLTASSAEAVIVMQMLPSADDTYRLKIASFDPNEQRFTTSVLYDGAWRKLSAGKTPVAKFITRKVPPGSYAFYTFEKQENWNLCFHRETMYFTVNPGQIVYLGTFDPNFHLAEMSRYVVQHGDTTVKQSRDVFYFDNISPPRITAPDNSEKSLAEVRKYIAAEMPQVRVDVQPVTYIRTKFGTGHSLFAERLCGGYFREDVRERKPVPE